MAQPQIHEFQVPQYRIDSIGRRRPLTLRKSFYAVEVLPSYARRGGQAWADKFACLPAHERTAIVCRLTATRVRYWARRMGYPDPIIYEATVRSLPGGGYVLVSTAPLRAEWGGDGRTPENTRHEQPRVSDTPALRHAVAKIKAQLAEKGIEVVYEDPPPEPDPVPKRKACAR